jgi:hypothetical protein
MMPSAPGSAPYATAREAAAARVAVTAGVTVIRGVVQALLPGAVHEAAEHPPSTPDTRHRLPRSHHPARRDHLDQALSEPPKRRHPEWVGRVGRSGRVRRRGSAGSGRLGVAPGCWTRVGGVDGFTGSRFPADGIVVRMRWYLGHRLSSRGRRGAAGRAWHRGRPRLRACAHFVGARVGFGAVTADGVEGFLVSGVVGD